MYDQPPDGGSGEPVLSVAGLCKTYSQIVAVADVSFEVHRREVVGLLGPNGAGKTTTINMILGVLSPTGGNVRIGGIDLALGRARALAQANFSAVYAALPGNLTVAQNLRFFGMIYGIPELGRRVAELLRQFDLERLLRQLYLIRGSPVRSLPMFAWVAIDIVVWGFITRYLNWMAAGRFNYVPSLLGAVLLWDFFTRIMQGVSTAFLEDVWSHNFLNLFATPLTISEYILGLVITSVGTSAVGLAVMLVLATAVFGLSFLSLGALLVPFLLVLFGFGIALGIVASALVLRLGPASEWLVWPMPALLSPFVGVF